MSAGPVFIQRFIWAVCRCLLAKLMLLLVGCLSKTFKQRDLLPVAYSWVVN